MGLREDWKALKEKKGNDTREGGRRRGDSSVSGVLWGEQGWDRDDRG